MGFSANFVQVGTVRDMAAMLDCISMPQPGDPFIIPKPAEAYASFVSRPAPRQRVGIILNDLAGPKVDPEVARAVEATGKVLERMGHTVEMAEADMGGVSALLAIFDLFFFAFDVRLDGYGRRTGRTPGPDTLEPVILSYYEYARTITPAKFMAAMSAVNVARRKLGAFYTNYDIWLSPTTTRAAEPWGLYNLSRTGIGPDRNAHELFAVPCQFTLPHNIMGTPAISMPLAMTASGLPIGVQLAARPAQEHVLIQLAAALEQEMPWRARVPPLHVSRM